MNKKFGILCLCLILFPACGPWNIKRSNVNNIQQPILYKKAYLYISDVECEECFKLLQGIILPIKGVREVTLEDFNFSRHNMPGLESNPVVISYDPKIKLNRNLIRSVLKDWNFDLQKIEL